MAAVTPGGGDAHLLVAVLLTVVTGALVARLLRLPSRGEAMLAGGLVAVALVVGTSLLLGGAFSALTPMALLLAAGSEFLGTVAVTCAAAKRGWPPLRERPRDLAAWLHVATSTQKSILLNPVASILAIVATAEVAWRSWLAARLPLLDYDGLAYHGVMAATWAQVHHISRVTAIVWANAYPGNIELTSAWVMSFLHNDHLADAIQIPFIVLGTLAIYVAARMTGLTRPSAVTAAAIWVLTPIVLAQSTTGYIDIACAALVMTAMCFLAAAVTGREGPARVTVTRLVLAGTATGLALGAKASFLQWAGLGLIGLIVFLGWQVHEGRMDRRRLGTWTAALLIPIAVFGSYFYVRDLVTYGNPVYPVNFAIGPVTLVHGLGTVQQVVIGNNVPPALRNLGGYDQVAKSWFSNPTSYTYDQRIGGLGPQWCLLLFPALVVGLFAAATTKRNRFYLLYAGPMLCSLWLMPAVWWSRYTVELIGPAAIGALLVIEHLMLKGWRRALRPVARLALLGTVLLGAFDATRVVALSSALYSTSQINRLAAQDKQNVPGDSYGFPEFAWESTIATHAGLAIPENAFPALLPFIGHDLQHRLTGIDTSSVEQVAAGMTRSKSSYFVVPRSDVLLVSQVNHDSRFRLYPISSYTEWVYHFVDQSPGKTPPSLPLRPLAPAPATSAPLSGSLALALGLGLGVAGSVILVVRGRRRGWRWLPARHAVANDGVDVAGSVVEVHAVAVDHGQAEPPVPVLSTRRLGYHDSVARVPILEPRDLAAPVDGADGGDSPTTRVAWQWLLVTGQRTAAARVCQKLILRLAPSQTSPGTADAEVSVVDEAVEEFVWSCERAPVTGVRP